MAKPLNEPEKLAAFLAALEHPLKPEISAVREIILGADHRITEGVKWNAPAFYYKGDMAVIHVKAQQHVMVIFPAGATIPDSTGLLEGTYPDGRRMAFFNNMQEVRDKAPLLSQVVKGWITVQDGQED